jgi:hypothetical protein
MQFIQGTNRQQTYFTTPDEQVSADNAIRLMDAFIDKLDLQKLGFTCPIHKSEGRPPYYFSFHNSKVLLDFSA